MAHLQHIPGDPRLVDQLVYELKSKGIFDQFRKECIADVDTRPAYQNLRQRVETSVTTFLARQCWQPDLNKNQLREKLRKHILDGNYLEQGVERIVDQVVNPKVASVFIPQVEDLVYNYLGITRKKSTPNAETSKEKSDSDSLLPTDLEAVSPGSVKSNDDKNEDMDLTDDKSEMKMEIDSKDNTFDGVDKDNKDSKMSTDVILVENDSIDKSSIPLPSEGIKLESIPHPKDSPPKIEESKIELEKIELPKNMKEPELSDIPLPDEIPKLEKNSYFKPVNTDEDDSSSDSSLRRNMSPLTPVRNFDNENSYDAQQAFENDVLNNKNNDQKEPSSFRFAIESKSSENSSDGNKSEKKDAEQLSYQFNNQVNINTFNTPMYDDSSNSNNLHIDYESDANSKVVNTDSKLDSEQNPDESKKEKKTDEKKSNHKSSHHSRDSHRHSSSKDKRSDSKYSNSRDSSRHDKKSSKDDNKSKSNHKDSSKERGDKKESVDSKHRSSHKSSSKDKDSRSHKSSSSRHSSKHDDRKSSSTPSSKDKEREKAKSSDKSSKEKSSKESRSSSSHRSSKDDRKKSSSSSSSSKKQSEKEKDKKEKKETDDHYSLSGRGNHSRRSTDRDSNDGSTSSKGSQNISAAKALASKKDSKSTSSKSGTTSTSSDTSPSDKDKVPTDVCNMQPVVRIENHLEMPFASPPRLPFVPDITLKKPKIASNMEEAKKMIKMRKFLEEEQKKMNQEAALLLEFQANVRPSLSQVYSSIPGPELEFACMMSSGKPQSIIVNNNETQSKQIEPQIEAINENIETNEASLDSEEILTFEELTVEQQLENIYAASYGEEENDNNINIEMATKMNIDETASEGDTTGETSGDLSFVSIDSQIMDRAELENILDGKNDKPIHFEVTIVSEDSEDECSSEETNQSKQLKYFTESERINSEQETVEFNEFLKTYMKKCITNKMFLINCDPYEENIFREVSRSEGDYEIVNYIKNGHLKLTSNSKNVVKDVNVAKEIVLIADMEENETVETFDSEIFSPMKSECSFELTSDYENKIDDMVNTTSRQEIMEIILGNVEQSPSKMPEINYYNEIILEGNTDNNLKRKLPDEDTSINNNEDVLTTPNKMRKISENDQISSTTEETISTHTQQSNNILNSSRSKYLIKARRVGLPKPKKTDLPNSPSSDKSVENYEQNVSKLPTPNGKMKVVRNKIQRYDTSDLYKPKLHYLSRRNHIT